MIVNNLGYIFECRADALDAVGVMGKYNILYKGDNANLSLTCSVDHKGKIVVPSRINKSIGFENLNSFCNTPEDIVKFTRSNKPYFYKIGDFAMLGSGTLVFDKNTKELILSDNFSFYVPVTVSKTIEQVTDSKGVIQPALICEKLSYVDGLNIFKVQDVIVKAYFENFFNSFKPEFLDGREAYLQSLVLEG